MTWTNEEIAARVGAEIEDGWLVNLGVGMPTLVAEQVFGRNIIVHSENGILGVGPPPEPGHEDTDIVDPGKNFATIVVGGAYMDSGVSFALIRGGHLDLAVMGAYQVSETGDLANWGLPGRRTGAIGGAADLVAGAQRIWAMTTHVAKDGSPKLVARCTYPLTGAQVVSRVFTDMAVLEVVPGGFRPVELAPGVSDAELRDATAGCLVP